MYSQFSFTATASILLVYGWILTSDKARAFIGDQISVKVGFTIVTAVIYIIEIYISYYIFYKPSKELCEIIGCFRGSIPKEAYDYKCIDGWTIVLFLGGHLLMYLLLLYLIWKSKPNQDAKEELSK